MRVSLGRDPDTRRYRYASATVRGTKRDAQKAAARLVSQADDGQLTASNATVATLLDRWYVHLEGQGRAPKTLSENRRLGSQISERLGTKSLRKLRGSDIDAFYDSLRHRGLAPASVRRYHAVLSASLRQAIRWGLLERSPIDQATPPSIPTAEPECPTPEQVRTLIEAAERDDPQLAAFIFVAASTGCRRGELCGLRWSDLDIEDRSMVIRRSVSDLPGDLSVRGTKTGRIRKLALDPATITVLSRQGDQAASTCQLVGATLGPDAYVFSQDPDHSNPWRPSRVTASFITLRNRAGLQSIRLHHLRHFAATVMLAGGVDIRTAAGRLGHTQPTLTLRTYAHVMQAADRQAAEIVGGAIAP